MASVAKPKNRNEYAGVINALEHLLRFDGSVGFPGGSHEDAARALEPGDAHRYLMEVAAELDKVKSTSARDHLGRIT